VDALESAVLDSGATALMLNPDSVNHLDYQKRNSAVLSVIEYGGGSTESSHTYTDVGTHEAIVVENLVDNLCSVDQLVDEGSYVLLRRSGGVVANDTDSQTIPISRRDGQFRIWITDLAAYDFKDPLLLRKPRTSSLRAQRLCYAGDSSLLKKELKRKKGVPIAQVHRVHFEDKWPSTAKLKKLRKINAESSSNQHPTGVLPPSFVEPPVMNDEVPLCVEIKSSRSAALYSSVELESIRVRARRVTGTNVMLEYINLHNRNHTDPQLMMKSVMGESPAWRNSNLTQGQMYRCNKTWKCPTCTLAKRRKDSIPINEVTEADKDPSAGLTSKNCGNGEIISMDPSGIINPATREGRNVFILFKDIKSKMLHTTVSQFANTETIQASIDIVFGWYHRHRFKPKILRCDSARHLISDSMKEWLWEKWECVIENSAPYAHWQNAVERDMQTVVNGASTLLHAQRWLTADCWDLALFHYVQLRNRTPTSKSFLSPYQQLTGHALDWNTKFKFCFGDLVAVALPGNETSREWKFDMKNQMGIYCGQPEEKHASLIYWPHSHTTSVRPHCWKIEVTDEQFLHHYNARTKMKSGALPFATMENAYHDFCVAAELDADALVKWQLTLSEPLVQALVEVDEEDPLETIDLSSIRNPLPPLSMKLRSNVMMESSRIAQTYEADTYGDFTDCYGGFMFESFTASAAKVTVGQALRSADRENWIQAIKDELIQLITGGTLRAVNDSEITGKYKVIHTTMQLKHKLKQDQSLDKWKARLCACGNELYGMIAETFSPTIGALAYATVHQIAILDRMEKMTVDTVGAYLHQTYPVDALPLYVVLPSNVAEVCGLKPDQKYRIVKYLYGLPDAGIAYYRAYSSHLIAKGYKRSLSDPCLFIKIEGKTRTYVWTHVDDTFVCSTHAYLLEIFVSDMREKFDITVVKDVEEYLGIKMEYMPNGDVKLTQPKLLSSLLEEHAAILGPETSRGIPTPQRPQDAYAIENSGELGRTEYLHLLGALIYLTKSRPDIATAVSFGACYSAKPTVGAYAELLQILHYLRRTRDYGLILRAGLPNRELVLRCYVDASYLTHADSKSHTGYTLSFGEMGTFYSRSSKQTLVATSSTHAEMRALYSLVVDVIFVIHLCEELGRPLRLPAIILEDNQPVIDVTTDINGRIKRCKHFLMLINYVKEQIVIGLISIVKVNTADNIADMLTKIITGSEFTKKAELLLGMYN
jgi:Reverse transcriptase (RNA-dependent DNA polymerase)